MKTLLLLVSLLLIPVISSAEKPICHTKAGYLAAKNIQMVKTANNLAASKNYTAMQQMQDSGLIFVLKEGVAAYLEETNSKEEKVKITFKDFKLTVWTSIRAVDCR